MTIITKTIISSCLYNRTVPCIYRKSHARLSAESYLNRLLSTHRPIIRIHTSRNATPIDTLGYLAVAETVQ